MTGKREDWGFRSTAFAALPEAAFALIASLLGIGIVLGVALIVQQIQIHSYFASLPGEIAATGRADMAVSVRPMAGLSCSTCRDHVAIRGAHGQ